MLCIMLSVIMLNVAFFIVMLSVNVLTVVMLSAIILNIVMLSAVMLNVVTLSVPGANPIKNLRT